MRKLILMATTAVFMAGCSSSSTPVNLQYVANQVIAIDQGLSNAISDPAVVKLFPNSKVPAQVETALADLNTIAKAAASAPDATMTKGNVQIIESDVNVILQSLGTLALPAPYPEVIAAVEVALPAIEAAVGVVVPAAK